jgi:hypothetical protein
MLTNIGLGMMANADKSPFEALGRGWLGAQEMQNQNVFRAQDQAMNMEQMNARRVEMEQEQQAKAQREEYIKRLTPEQQLKARSIPGYLEKLIEATDPSLQQGMEPTAGMRDFQFAQENPEYMNFLNRGQGGGDISMEAQQRMMLADQMGLSQDDPQYKAYVLTGKMPREDAAALTATDKKALWASEDELPGIEGTVQTLERALTLNDNTFTGMGSGVAGTIGAKVPYGDVLFDKAKAKNTVEFGQIMSMEAINSMAESLKGATTNFELNEFKTILADPATPPDIRERTIKRMLTLAKRKRQILKQRINSIAGNPQPEASDGGDDPLSAARDAISRGADPEAVRQRLMDNGIDPSGL